MLEGAEDAGRLRAGRCERGDKDATEKSSFPEEDTARLITCTVHSWGGYRGTSLIKNASP